MKEKNWVGRQHCQVTSNILETNKVETNIEDTSIEIDKNLFLKLTKSKKENSRTKHTTYKLLLKTRKLI